MLSSRCRPQMFSQYGMDSGQKKTGLFIVHFAVTRGALPVVRAWSNHLIIAQTVEQEWMENENDNHTSTI